MARYEYRCDDDGPFELTLPMGTQPATAACPACGDESRRAFSTPLLACAPRALVAAMDHAEGTRDRPDVVTALPPRDPRRRTPTLPLTPTLRRLPRP